LFSAANIRLSERAADNLGQGFKNFARHGWIMA
jgi:hypothetical protein